MQFVNLTARGKAFFGSHCVLFK